MEALYTFSGQVQRGKSRGKDLGFPTANIPLVQKIPEGVYFSRVSIDNTWHHALTFVGSAKTFGESEYKAETYILNFAQDIYGKTLHVELLRHVRDNMQFESPASLITQMKKDKEQAEQFFATII